MIAIPWTSNGVDIIWSLRIGVRDIQYCGLQGKILISHCYSYMFREYFIGCPCLNRLYLLRIFNSFKLTCYIMSYLWVKPSKYLYYTVFRFIYDNIWIVYNYKACLYLLFYANANITNSSRCCYPHVYAYMHERIWEYVLSFKKYTI